MSRRKQESHELICTRRRQQILSAAAKIIARKGFMATKMADIAAASDMSYGLIYHYFKGKDEIFAELVKHSMWSTVDALQQSLKLENTPLERLGWLFAELLRMLRTEPESAMVVVQALSTGAASAPLRDVARNDIATSQKIIQRLIEEERIMQCLGTDDARILAVLFVACLQGLAIESIYLGGPTTTHLQPQMLLRILHTRHLTDTHCNTERG